MNSLLEFQTAIAHWRKRYAEELKDCDEMIAKCEAKADSHGTNFYQGRRSALIDTDISLHRLKELADQKSPRVRYVGGEPPPEMSLEGPMCADPACFRSRPHTPREYGCRWSDRATVNKNGTITIFKDEHGRCLPENITKQCWF